MNISKNTTYTFEDGTLISRFHNSIGLYFDRPEQADKAERMAVLIKKLMDKGFDLECGRWELSDPNEEAAIIVKFDDAIGVAPELDMLFNSKSSVR